MPVTAPTPVGRCPPIGIHLEGIILPSILTLDVILGLLGNVVAFWIFCWKLKSWKCTVLFLFNVLIADFFVLVSLPLRIDALLRGYWVFGDGMCRINLFLMFTNHSASIGLMTVVVIYRYFKVVHPYHRFNRMTKRQAWYAAAFLWMLVIGPRVPMLAFSHIKGEGNHTQCFFFTSYGEASRAILVLVRMHRILSVLEFLVPLAMLLFCSARIFCVLKRRQIDMAESVRACTAIVVVFVVCFLPGTVTTFGLWVIGAQRPIDCASFYALTQLTAVSLGLNFVKLALDPVMYYFCSIMFQNALVSALPKVLRGGGGCCGGAGDGGEGEGEEAAVGTQSTAQQELLPLPTENARKTME